MSFEGAAISLGATVISLAFASLVLAQWLGRRGDCQHGRTRLRDSGRWNGTARQRADFLAPVHGPRKRRPDRGRCILVLAISAVVQLVDRDRSADYRRWRIPRPIQHFLGLVCRRTRRDCGDVRRLPPEPGLGESREALPCADGLLTRTLKYLRARPTRVEDRRGSRRESQDRRSDHPPLRRGRVDERDYEGTPRVGRGGRPRRLGGPTSRGSRTTRPGMGLASGRAVRLVHSATEGGARR